MNITKINITFEDGKELCLVTQDRFLAIRDALKAQSDANGLLCKQAELMEKRIAELQAECHRLTQENQSAINDVVHYEVDGHPFHNPLA